MPVVHEVFTEESGKEFRPEFTPDLAFACHESNAIAH
jgi:hypothetical protein